MRKRLLATVLVCALLTGCGFRRTEPREDPPDEGGRTLAYIPLDDRPDNVERAVYLARSLDYTVLMPEADDYRTRLDGQPRNENGTPFGDRGALWEWLLDREADGCDRYVLSFDQLLSGGLVQSRCSAGEDVTLSDGTVLTETELVTRIVETLAADENNTVWLLDSVMRLAPTVGYAGGDLTLYNALRAYGMEPRPALGAAERTVDDVTAAYPLGADGAALSPADFALTPGEVTEYLAARTRKLERSAQLLSHLRSDRTAYGRFHVLVGIDDSSASESIQKNEIALLRDLLREGDALLSGVDDLAFKAVARLYLDETPSAAAPRVEVTYFGGTEDRPACAYDSQPLAEIVAEHLAFFGLEETPEGGELRLLVLTQPEDPTRKAEYCGALIEAVQAAEKTRCPVMVMDAGNGQYGTAFHDALTERCELGRLLSYAGFLDMAIVTGTVLSHGAARYAYLRGEPTEGGNRAFCRTLADSIVKDFCYKNVVREEILAYVRRDLAGNADNFWQPEIDRDAVMERLKDAMDGAARRVLENLEHSSLIVNADAYRSGAGGLAGWGGVALDNYRFPWDRAFEIGMDITLGAFTEPHEKKLGLWVS